MPNPNLTGPPFVDGFTLPAAGLNRLAPLDNPVFTGTVQGVSVTVFGPEMVSGSGSFYISDTPAGVINRVSDRLFVGQAATAYDGSTTDTTWLATYNGLNNLATAQFGVFSTKGLGAILGASRSSDFGALDVNRAIGGTFYGVNDRTDASDGWGVYAEGIRASGNTGFTAAGEFDVGNHGSTVDNTPYVFGTPAGTNVGLWVISGQGAATAPSTMAIGVGTIGQKHRKGIVFQATALDTALGNGGNGVAVEVASGQSVRWIKADGTTLGEIWTDSGGFHIKAPSGTVTTFA